jgi:hypothetical protein
VSDLPNIMTFGGNGDLLAELNRQGVRFLIIGGLAVRCYVPLRACDDLDILVEPTLLNAERCANALQYLGLERPPASALMRPKVQMPLKDWHCADIVTPATEVDFAAEWETSAPVLVNDQPVRVASRELL